MTKKYLLSDLIEDLFEDLSVYHRKRTHFYKWLGNFESLRKLVEQSPEGILIKDKDKFINELRWLTETNQIKAKIF